MLETTPAVRRVQWLAIALIATSMALGFLSDAAALKILADLLVAAAAVVMLVALVLAWRASRRLRRSAR